MKLLSLRRQGCGIVTSLAALALLLPLGNIASAENIVYSGTDFDVTVSDPVDVGIALKAVTLTATGKSGKLLSGFDGVSDGMTGIVTQGDSLHQVWQIGALETPTLTQTEAVELIPAEIFNTVDTHFLFEEAEILGTVNPTETRGVQNDSEHAYAGFGDQLTGTFVLNGVALPTWEFAYVVVPDGTEVTLDFDMSILGQNPEFVSSSFLVPEPGTLMLLALGGLVALPVVCRRRAAK